MSWKDINKQFKFTGQGDPNKENKYLFYLLIFILVATILYILTFYFKEPKP